jgi:hypothetical protein
MIQRLFKGNELLDEAFVNHLCANGSFSLGNNL